MKNKILVLGVFVFVLVLIPVITYAQGLTEFLINIRDWLNMLVPMLITLGIIAFFWGLAMYLFKEGEDKAKGLNIMMMGVLAVFVMASLGGLIGMLQTTTGAGDDRTIQPPCVGAACP